jgi:hypothetical protein
VSHRWGERIALGIGLLLVGAGIWQLLPQRSPDVWQNATYTTNSMAYGGPPPEPNFLGWGTLLLGFLTLASTHYFKLRDARRADRAEARDIARERRATDDVN